jgi:dTDP-glucose 4,6-dehydratase
MPPSGALTPPAPGASVLVTGGAGFIGSRLVTRLLADTPWRVVTLDRLTYAGNRASLGPALDHPRHTFVHGDIGDRTLVGDLLRAHRPRAVLHVAAESHVDRSIDGPAAFAVTNVLGTVALLTATLDHWRTLDATARAAFRFLAVSTDEVYGSVETGEAGPGSVYAPRSPYAASKAASDHFVHAFHHTYGLPVLTTHGSNTYGPFQYPEKLVPLLILNAIEGRPLPLYGDGGNVRDWLHVDDHVRALQCVLAEGAPGGVYPVAGAHPLTNLEVAHAVCDLVDQRIPGRPSVRTRIRFVPDRPGHDRRYAVDASALRALGWAPGTPFPEGLEQTVAWYLDNPAWLAGVAAHRERLGAHGG